MVACSQLLGIFLCLECLGLGAGDTLHTGNTTEHFLRWLQENLAVPEPRKGGDLRHEKLLDSDHPCQLNTKERPSRKADIPPSPGYEEEAPPTPPQIRKGNDGQPGLPSHQMVTLCYSSIMKRPRKVLQPKVAVVQV